MRGQGPLGVGTAHSGIGAVTSAGLDVAHQVLHCVVHQRTGLFRIHVRVENQQQEAAGEGMEEGSLGRAVALHEQAALITAVGSVLVALLRGGLMVLKRYEGWPRLLSLFLFTLLIASVARTGYLGGQLVYRHAAGVELSLPAISDTE